MKYLVVVYEKTETGYSAFVPDLPGCISAGETLEETKGLIREAAAFHLTWMREDGLPLPEPSTRSEYLELNA